MDRRRFDGGRDRRADGEAQFFACAARDQRIQRESAVERHAINGSFRRDRDDLRGQMIARAGMRRRLRLERHVLGANARVYGGSHRSRLTLGDVNDGLPHLHGQQSFPCADDAARQDRLDGLTVDLDDWWFNLRPSNTEPLLRLNLEARDRAACDAHTAEVLALIRGN